MLHQSLTVCYVRSSAFQNSLGAHGAGRDRARLVANHVDHAVERGLSMSQLTCVPKPLLPGYNL
jgi:hypothetical protein